MADSNSLVTKTHFHCGIVPGLAASAAIAMGLLYVHGKQIFDLILADAGSSLA